MNSMKTTEQLVRNIDCKHEFTGGAMFCGRCGIHYSQAITDNDILFQSCAQKYIKSLGLIGEETCQNELPNH